MPAECVIVEAVLIFRGGGELRCSADIAKQLLQQNNGFVLDSEKVRRNARVSD